MGVRFEVTDEDELAHAATIQKRLQQSLILLQRFDLSMANTSPAGSTLAGDDAATAPFQTSHTVVTSLVMATENIRALHRLLLDDGRLIVPMYAHYPVIRSVLEASSLAKWILEPESRSERILRSLRARAEDIKQDRSLHMNEVDTLRAMDVIGSGPQEWAQRIEAEEASNSKQFAADQETLRALCLSHGLSWQAVKAGLPPWLHLIKSVNTVPRSDDWNTIPGSYAAGIWKVMSGLSHPSVSRSVNHSSIERLESDDQSPGDGTFLGQLSASLEWTDQALTVALNAVSEAISLFASRQGRPQLPLPKSS